METLNPGMFSPTEDPICPVLSCLPVPSRTSHERSERGKKKNPIVDSSPLSVGTENQISLLPKIRDLNPACSVPAIGDNAASSPGASCQPERGQPCPRLSEPLLPARQVETLGLRHWLPQPASAPPIGPACQDVPGQCPRRVPLVGGGGMGHLLYGLYSLGSCLASCLRFMTRLPSRTQHLINLK